jgi:hypothetical protein
MNNNYLNVRYSNHASLLKDSNQGYHVVWCLIHRDAFPHNARKTYRFVHDTVEEVHEFLNILRNASTDNLSILLNTQHEWYGELFKTMLQYNITDIRFIDKENTL